MTDPQMPEPGRPISQRMSLEVDHSGLSDSEELAIITILECFSRADKIEGEMFTSIDLESDTVLDSRDTVLTPLMRVGSAVAQGAREPITDLVNRGLGAHQAIPLAIKSLVIQSFLAGIEYRKVTNPEKE